jgi:hypothetical protein
MAYESILNEALELSKSFKIYPLAKFSNIPIKGSHGELGATQEQAEIVSWFETDPLISIGISLKDSNVLVIDVDDKDGTGNVLKELAKLTNGNSLEDAVVVKTPTFQGFHMYFKYPLNMTIENDGNFRKGIEILTTKVTAPGSRKKLKDGSIGEYELKSGSLSDLKDCPHWLLEAIAGKQQARQQDSAITLNYSNTAPKGKTWTSKFLEEIVTGVSEPGRNIWLIAKLGKLISLGMNSREAYQLIHVINESFVTPKLPETEVNALFKSVIKAESRKAVKR